MADAGHDFGVVLFDLHAAAAAVATLAAHEVGRDVGFGEGEAGGEALDDHGEALAVAFARGEHAELAHQWRPPWLVLFGGELGRGLFGGARRACPRWAGVAMGSRWPDWRRVRRWSRSGRGAPRACSASHVRVSATARSAVVVRMGCCTGAPFVPLKVE